MSILNQAVCVSDVGNTGVGDCYFTPALVRSGFLVPSDFEIPAAALVSETATLAYLETATLNPAGTRIYPLPEFEAITDNSADPTIATLGYGGSFPARMGDISWLFQFLKGGICLLNQLKKFNNSDYKVIFVDDNGAVFGTKNATNDGIAGIPLVYFLAYDWKAADGSNPTVLRIGFVFRPQYINQYIAYAPGETVSYSDVAGVKNVKLTIVTRVTATLNVTAVESCGGKDLHAKYPTELASASEWDVTNTVSGNPVIITSVTSTATGWALLLDATDPDYNTTAGGMLVSLAPTATLATAGVKKFDSKPIPSIAP